MEPLFLQVFAIKQPLFVTDSSFFCTELALFWEVFGRKATFTWKCMLRIALIIKVCAVGKLRYLVLGLIIYDVYFVFLQF